MDDSKLYIEKKNSATHIFFKKLSADLYNVSVLRELAGQCDHIQSLKEGGVTGVRYVAPEVLMLKPGCKIMLTWNMFTKLRNGSQGTFVTVVDN